MDDERIGSVEWLVEMLECLWADAAPDEWTEGLDAVGAEWKPRAKRAIERYVRERTADALKPCGEDEPVGFDPDDYPLF